MNVFEHSHLLVDFDAGGHVVVGGRRVMASRCEVRRDGEDTEGESGCFSVFAGHDNF
jgi:hypothetical protein